MTLTAGKASTIPFKRTFDVVYVSHHKLFSLPNLHLFIPPFTFDFSNRLLSPKNRFGLEQVLSPADKPAPASPTPDTQVFSIGGSHAL
jgi:hypothetical protein